MITDEGQRQSAARMQESECRNHLYEATRATFMHDHKLALAHVDAAQKALNWAVTTDPLPSILVDHPGGTEEVMPMGEERESETL